MWSSVWYLTLLKIKNTDVLKCVTMCYNGNKVLKRGKMKHIYLIVDNSQCSSKETWRSRLCFCVYDLKK